MLQTLREGVGFDKDGSHAGQTDVLGLDTVIVKLLEIDDGCRGGSGKTRVDDVDRSS